MGNRIEYIEDGEHKPIKIEEPKPLDESVHYPVLARYDFAGRGPRPGVKKDEWLYQQARFLRTRGERLKPIIIRMGWIFLQLAVGLAFIYFILHGNTFNCEGTEYIFR